jgi:hypothetical protein
MSLSYESDRDQYMERYSVLAKRFVSIDGQGEVSIIVEGSDKERILLYLIGKLYARKDGLVPSEFVDRSELVEKLGIPEASLVELLKELGNKQLISRSRMVSRMGRRGRKSRKGMEEGRTVYYSVMMDKLGPVLKMIEARLSGSDITVNNIYAGLTQGQREMMKSLLSIIQALEKKGIVNEELVIDEAKLKGIDEAFVRQALTRLKNNLILFEERPGFLKVFHKPLEL